MKYSIGYQLPDEYCSTYELCRDYDEKVSEVYFSFSDEPSGRASLVGETAEETERIRALQLAELKEIKRLGKRLTLLYNANCYGEGATSVNLKNHILKLTDFLKSELEIDAVTTTSPFLAKILKQEYRDDLQLRTSVNMRIGSIQAMEQLSEYFDGFYLKKECNRNFAKIEKLKSWCDLNGKKLHILANSGCLDSCAFQTFHDNLIAHGVGENEVKNVNMGFSAPCHEYLHNFGPEHGITRFLQGNWIPPELVHLYEPYFSEMKLATRMHSRVRMVLSAYCRERFTGNLLDLTEPSFSSLFKGYVLDATKVSNEWYTGAFSCNKECFLCDICHQTVKKSVFFFGE